MLLEIDVLHSLMLGLLYCIFVSYVSDTVPAYIMPDGLPETYACAKHSNDGVVVTVRKACFRRKNKISVRYITTISFTNNADQS